jgi:hypothetical protein
MTPTGRRFPSTWSIEDTGAAFVVKDCGSQKLAYVYYEEESGRLWGYPQRAPQALFSGVIMESWKL